MREIILDTETTGLRPAEGHRLVEIGCLELINHVPTGEIFHCYINPERDMPEAAFAVHGLSEEFLRDKPLFKSVAEEFLGFIETSPLIIHNAAFDLSFLNAELSLIDRDPLSPERAIDTLEIARRKFPGAQNNLDALCRRFNVDNSNRTRHGALLDAELLAEVYLELIGGRQPGLILDTVPNALEETAAGDAKDGGGRHPARRPRGQALPPRLTAEEDAAHAAFIATLGEEPFWLNFGRD